MEKADLNTFPASNIDINAQALELLTQNSKNLSLGKGEFALREGETCKHIFFIRNGLLKQYSIDPKGKEHILLFAPENWFVSNIESVYFNRPSSYFMQAVEDTQMLLINEELVGRLSLLNETFLELNNQVLRTHILTLQSRVTQLLSASAEDRYLDFARSFPQLLKRIPQWMIASFLGVTPESLSRLRGELAGRASHSRQT